MGDFSPCVQIALSQSLAIGFRWAAISNVCFSIRPTALNIPHLPTGIGIFLYEIAFLFVQFAFGELQKVDFVACLVFLAPQTVLFD